MCNAPPKFAQYYSTLQHAATRCNTLQHAATRCKTGTSDIQCTTDIHTTLQHAATCCNTLQHNYRQYPTRRQYSFLNGGLHTLPTI